jgi:dephospho-CoA kinase
VLSSDAVVHELYRRPGVRDAVVERVGSQVLGADGEVDRAALGVLDFADPALLDDLERLVHPLVAVETEPEAAVEAEPEPEAAPEAPPEPELGLSDDVFGDAADGEVRPADQPADAPA